MEEMRYTISDAAKMVKVESHVLRYWEDELSLEIPRNEMGHRYYTQKEVDVFCHIRALKERGFQLKSIKDVMEILFDDGKMSNIISLENVRQSYEENEVQSENVEETQMVSVEKLQKGTIEKITAEEKMRHFKYIMDAIITQALQANNILLEDELVDMVAERIMNDMGSVEKEREEREEARFRKLDEMIRGRQKGYSEVAATKLPPYTPTKMKRRRLGLFRRT